MVIYPAKEPDGSITLRARVDGPGGTIGDLERVLRPGSSFRGRGYSWWDDHLAGGGGPVDVPDVPSEAAGAAG
jgi:hypothetical protein